MENHRACCAGQNGRPAHILKAAPDRTEDTAHERSLPCIPHATMGRKEDDKDHATPGRKEDDNDHTTLGMKKDDNLDTTPGMKEDEHDE